MDLKEDICQRKEKVLLWGAGNVVKEMLKNICFFEDCILIVGITDSDSKKWGQTIEGIEVKPFGEISYIPFDKVVVASILYFDEIRTKLTEELGIDDSIIENQYYFAKIKLLEKYAGSTKRDIQKITGYLATHRLEVFNYEFASKYKDLNAEIYFDKEAKMFYVMHLGRKMYMARKLDTKKRVLEYYQSICMEQDMQSPHLYLDEQFMVQEGDVVVDAGVAEGNFALQIIDKADKIYLVEADKEWVEALRYTFAPYANKVVILNKLISDYIFGNTDTLDHLIEDKVNFIKLDIEGCECEALLGAKRLIEKSDRMKCAVCAYHRDNDEISIEGIAHRMGLSPIPARGYMYYYNDEKQRYISPVLRRGVLKYEKK